MDNYKHSATVFKALCDESRLRIIDLIKDGETCSCVLLQDLTIGQSTLSHHMKILVESGIVITRKEGKRTMYSLYKNGIDQLKNIINDIFRIDDTSGNNNVSELRNLTACNNESADNNTKYIRGVKNEKE